MLRARAGLLAPLAAWAGLSLLMLWLCWPTVIGQRFVDADDMMRLMEVRDWIAGQSWWDVSQYRIGPVALSMHWSRLVDVPLALVEWPLIPLVGRQTAETAAIAIVPILTFAAAAWAVVLLARRLFGPGPGMSALAVALLAASPSVLVQIRPGRIDHHGWQIAFAGLAVAALLGGRPRRDGWQAGFAMAASLNISLEQLPFAAALGGLLALAWVMGREAGARLTGYTAGLATGSAALLAAVAPVGRWSMPWCDAILPQHVLALGLAATGVAATVRFVDGPILRFVALGLSGAAALAVLATVAPRCLAGPFGAMGPLSRTLWLANVSEGLPIWRQQPADALSMFGFPLIGVLGSAQGWRAADGDEARRRWLIVSTLLVVSLGLATLLPRAGGTANLLGVPGALGLLQRLAHRLDRSRSSLVRVVGGAAGLFALSPMGPTAAAALISPDPTTPAKPAETCDTPCGLAVLDRLPPALFFTAIDLGPRLVLVTHHRAWTGAYHRSGQPMEDTLAAFTRSPDAARRLVAGTHARYLLIAPDSGEAKVYAAAAPHGLMAQLVAGRVPAWLEPLPTRTHDLSLFRVRPDPDGPA